MVECRKYSDFSSLKNCADLIYRECAERGLSEGWSGTQEDFGVVERLCEKLGIEYVDDFHGTWKPKKNQTKKEAEESGDEKCSEEPRERTKMLDKYQLTLDGKPMDDVPYDIKMELRAIARAEEIGVYEWKMNGKLMEYWSFFGSEGWYFIRYDLELEKEVFRGANIPWDGSLSNPVPAFLVADGGGLLYNYMQG